MVSRRQLLAVAASGAAALATWRFVGSSEQDGIVAVLRKCLDYLVLDETGVRAFAADLAAHKRIAGSKLRLIDAVGPVYPQLGPGSALSQSLVHGEERVVSLYLLSSDFFQNGADETRSVQYLGYYDPVDRARPCGNPFSRPPLV